MNRRVKDRRPCTHTNYGRSMVTLFLLAYSNRCQDLMISESMKAFHQLPKKFYELVVYQFSLYHKGPRSNGHISFNVKFICLQFSQESC